MKIKVLFEILFFLYLSGCKEIKEPLYTTEIERIKNDLYTISSVEPARSYSNLESLNRTADYIHSELSKVCDTVYRQKFNVLGKEYQNIIGSLGSKNQKRIIIGAHYDVCENQPGADDNASGVTGVLELARLLTKENLKYRLDFVAYSLEEPPYFRTKNMGSYVHAKWLNDNKIDVKGMICLEMIGYFNDKPNSQEYPLGILRWFYGSKGDYITVVQKFNNGRFGDKVKRLMTKQKLLPTKSFTGPKKLPGIDFSDHRNYWEFGYSAVMITNTAFYRNPNYHKPTDTMETLDLNRMSKVIDEVAGCVLNL